MASGAEAEAWAAHARLVAGAIRRRVLEHVLKHDGGYLSQACSSAEILATLYTRIMRLGPSIGAAVPPARGPGPLPSGRLYNGPCMPELDRFVLSPTHYALALYATLVETGRMAAEALEQYNTDGSLLEMIGEEHSPGHEVTGGSFGQAISQAAGIAAARKLRGDTGQVWLFMSDGEFQEGQVWEALNVMAFHRIDTVGIYVDVNGQQVDGRMADVMNLEPFLAKVSSFGARAAEVDGHDVEALAAAALAPCAGKPLVVLARTVPFKGIEILGERSPHLHYVRFRSDEERDRYRGWLDRMPRGTVR
jgi:transketolase